jgi:hypothetical protein
MMRQSRHRGTLGLCKTLVVSRVAQGGCLRRGYLEKRKAKPRALFFHFLSLNIPGEGFSRSEIPLGAAPPSKDARGLSQARR